MSMPFRRYLKILVMNLFKSLIPEDVLSQYYFLIVAVVVLGALYINDNWSSRGKLLYDTGLVSYGYQDHNGEYLLLYHNYR